MKTQAKKTERIELSQEVLGQPLTVSAMPAGSDWNVTILGGCTPHIGSVSLAEYKDGAVALRTLECRDHRDGILSESFARRLAQQTGTTVCVTCGIHYDNPGQDGLDQILAAAQQLLEQLCAKISG